MSDQPFSPNAAALIANNQQHVAGFTGQDVPVAPKRALAVVACMDTRVDVLAALGIDVGEAHILRNAGGIITEDTIRSLSLSQRALGTREILLMHHTKCGLHNLDEEQFVADLAADVGATPQWALGGFDDPHSDVRASIAILEDSPFVPFTDQIGGFVYDVETGQLVEVTETSTDTTASSDH